MFELLAPVFAVAGGLLAGIPIVLHMLRRTPAEKMPFSVVKFLTPSVPTTTKRSRLEHWPLMLLRILAVALIALAFARPFRRESVARENESGPGRRVAVLLDASASMRRDGLRDQVAAAVRRVTESLGPDDILSMTRFSDGSTTLLSADEWQRLDPSARAARVEEAIESWEPGWLTTHTDAAILQAADEVARDERVSDGKVDRSITLITDFQQGSRLDALRSASWPDGVRLDLQIVQPAVQGNAGLSLVSDQRTGRVRVRVTNSGDAATSSYKLQAFDAAGAVVGSPLPVEIAPGQRRTISLPVADNGKRIVAGVELLGDPHPFDNVADLPLAEPTVLRIGHAGSTDANDPESMLYYLQRTLDGNESRPMELVSLLAADGIALPVPPEMRLVFVTGIIPQGLIDSLQAMLHRGGTVWLALPSVEAAQSVKSLIPAAVTISEATVDEYAILGRMDFNTPLFTPFSAAQFADFSSIRIWHHRKLGVDPSGADAPRVIAAFDSGDAALLEFPFSSAGRLFVQTAGWHPSDSQWALSTRFPAMIQRLIQLAHPQQAADRLFDAGSVIIPQQLAGAGDWTLTTPTGEQITPASLTEKQAALAAAAASDSATPKGLSGDSRETVSSATVVLDVPGRWVLSTPRNGVIESIPLLVTVAASESRTEALPAGQLQALGLPADAAPTGSALEDGSSNPADAARLNAIELESRQRVWRTALLTGLGLLVLEGLVSAWIERRRQQTGPADAAPAAV
jgi:hypothetical protein